MVAALVYGARASHIPFKGHKSHPLLRKLVFPEARPKTESPEDRGKTEPLEHVKVNGVPHISRHFPKGESSGICSERRVISIRRSPGSNSSFIGDRSAPSVPTQCKISATTCGSSLHFPWPGYMAATLISCPGSFLRPARSTPSQRGSVLNQEAPGLPGMI